MKNIKQLNIDGRSILQRPAYDPNSLKGTLILLHGYGADEYDLMGLANYFEANLQIFSIRAPGVTPFGGASWFDIDMFADGSLKFNYEQAIESSRGVISLIKQMRTDGLIGDDRVIMGGFSQGATIASLVTLQAPELIQALLIMSGRLQEQAMTLLGDVSSLQDLPVFIGHGLVDQVIPVEFGRMVVKFWESLPVDLEHHEYSMGHEINTEELNHIQAWMNPIINA